MAAMSAPTAVATPAAGAAQPNASTRQPGPLREGLRNLGGTMRLGTYPCTLPKKKTGTPSIWMP